MQSNNPHGSTNPANGTGSDGKGLGNKIKGVYEVIHGYGENLRGSFLGAIDTMLNKSTQPTRNDEIAERGRAEVQRGMSRLGRGPAVSVAPGPATAFGEANTAGYGYGSSGVTQPLGNTGTFKRPEPAYEQTTTAAQPPIPARHAPGDPAMPAIPNTQTAHPVGTLGGGPGYGFGNDKGGVL